MGKSSAKTKAQLQALSTSKTKGNIYVLAGIILLTLLLYSSSFNNGILYGWDDGEYLDDKHISELNFKNTVNYFSHYYLGMYQPLSVLTIAINHHFSGSKPAPYHATNVLLHLISIILVYILFMRLTQNRLITGMAALFFAIHPMNVESVAWLAARSTTLFSVFYLGALLSYLEYQKAKSIKYYFIALILFACSLFSKSMAITLPLVLILLDYMKTGNLKRKALADKIPFLLLSFIFGMVTIDAAKSFGHLEGMEYSFTILNRLFILSYAIVFYLVKFVFPVKLSAIYGFPEEKGGWLPAEYYLSFVIILLIIFACWKAKSFRKELIFGFSFFLITISPVLPVFWSRMFLAGERYVYLPYLGLIYLFINILNILFASNGKWLFRYRTSIYILCIVYSGFLALATYQRIKVWGNPERLLSAVIEQKHSKNTLAAAYFFRGNVRDRIGEYRGALDDFNESLKRNPDNVLALNNRGIVRGIMKDLNGAISDFNRSIELKPEYADAYYNRGIAYYELKQPANACKDWQMASSLGSALAIQAVQKYCRAQY